MSIAGLELVVRPPQNRFGWWGLLAATVVALVVLWWTAVGAQIKVLNVRSYEGVAVRGLNQRKYRLAERARLRVLSKAPFAGEPIGRENKNEGVGTGNFPVKRALPIGR